MILSGAVVESGINTRQRQNGIRVGQPTNIFLRDEISFIAPMFKLE
jgi:hypothetical protein